MAYTRYKGDPYWKRAKVGGTSADGTPYAKGDRVFFYPRSGATYAGDAATRASAEFDELAAEATEIGFEGVMSWPLVRSSYRAGRLYRQATDALAQHPQPHTTPRLPWH